MDKRVPPEGFTAPAAGEARGWCVKCHLCSEYCGDVLRAGASQPSGSQASYPVWAAVIEIPWTGWPMDNRTLEAGKSKVKASADLVSGEGQLPRLLSFICNLACNHLQKELAGSLGSLL